MRIGENIKNKEGGLTYEVVTDRFNPIIIKVYKTDNPSKCKIVEHELEIPQARFGYDILDVGLVENKLDDMIEEMKKEKL